MNTVVHPRTAHINRAQKEQSKKACIDALAWLSKTFPQAFDTETRVRPLKIGIMDDVLVYVKEQEVVNVSRSKLRQALVMFTRRMEYLVCLKCREERVDLSGAVAGTVSAEDAGKAVEKIKKRVAKSIREKHAPKKDVLSLALTRETHPALDVKSVSDIPITRKMSRRLDPDAVARFKAKLGIAKESA